MRVAVFGGTGFVGGYLVDALLEAGHEPSVLVRPGSEGKIRQSARCRLVSGDIGSSGAVLAALEGCGAAIYNIGILREVPRAGITFEALQYEGAVRVVDAAKESGVKRMLLMSANGVKRPGTPYQETKLRAEEYAKGSGLDVTIFRPSVIFGDPRGTMEIGTQLYGEMIAPPLPAIGFFTGLSPARGQVLMSPVHVGDVADAFVRALEADDTIGRTYVLGGPEALSWTEMLGRIASAVGRRKWILPMPLSIMKLAATLLDWIPLFPVTRDQLVMLAEGNVAAPADVEALVGRPPRAFTPENLAYLAR